MKPIWITDSVFVVAPLCAVALAVWGGATSAEAIAVISASLGYAAGRPVGTDSSGGQP